MNNIDKNELMQELKKLKVTLDMFEIRLDKIEIINIEARLCNLEIFSRAVNKEIRAKIWANYDFSKDFVNANELVEK